MDKVYKSSINGEKLTIGIVVGRFNDFITDKLLDGAVNTLTQYGVSEDNIHVVKVPGAFEIPLIAKLLAEKDEYDAIITLGAVIRGDTPHFDYVCNEAAQGISSVALQTEKPVIFGILTTDTTEQALERSGIKGGNKGAEAAIAAVEMANLVKSISAKK